MVADAGGVGGEAWDKIYPIRLSVTMVARWYHSERSHRTAFFPPFLDNCERRNSILAKTEAPIISSCVVVYALVDRDVQVDDVVEDEPNIQ